MNTRGWGWGVARRRAAGWGWGVIDRMAFAPTGRLVNGLLQVGILGALAYAVARRELRKPTTRIA